MRGLGHGLFWCEIRYKEGWTLPRRWVRKVVTQNNEYQWYLGSRLIECKQTSMKLTTRLTRLILGIQFLGFERLNTSLGELFARIHSHNLSSISIYHWSAFSCPSLDPLQCSIGFATSFCSLPDRGTLSQVESIRHFDLYRTSLDRQTSNIIGNASWRIVLLKNGMAKGLSEAKDFMKCLSV